MSDSLLEALDKQLSSAGLGRKESNTPPLSGQIIPPFYYDGKCSYLYADEDGFYFAMDNASLCRRLADGGYYRLTENGKIEVSSFITLIQDKHAVHYTGGLAGYSAGLHRLPCGHKILVTQTIRPVSPVPGPWPLLQGIIEGMFFSEGADQRPYFYGWLKVFSDAFFETLEKGVDATPTPGQALILAGPSNSGKSLLKKIIIKLFGGKSEHPYQYMTGRTTFNAQLAPAPILEVDDQAASRDPRDRQTLAANIKEFAFSGAIQVHPKYQTPISLSPCQRMLFCLNDEPASLMVLPAMEPNLEDKLMLLKVKKCEMPMDTSTPRLRRRFWDALVAELPAFMHFLGEFEIPEDLISPRCGVRHFHHPAILAALDETAPENRLLEMIDKLMKGHDFSVAENDPAKIDLGESEVGSGRPNRNLDDEDGTPWIGSATEFEAIIRSRFERWQTERLFRYDNSAGMLLRTLSNNFPARVAFHSTVRGQSRWRIYPPELEGKPPVEADTGNTVRTRLGRIMDDTELEM